MGAEQVFTIESEAVGRRSVVSDDLVQNIDQNTVKDSASEFHNFHVNFNNFHALSPTRLS
jgi:hypothetical protein